MSKTQWITQIIETHLKPSVLHVKDESSQHHAKQTASHFSITVVSTDFEPLTLLERHRLVYKLLAEQLPYSPSMHLYTPTEWQKIGLAPQSPTCHHQSFSSEQ